MSNYGITDGGFVVKPFEVIVTEIEEDLQGKLGNDVVLIPEDPLKEIVDSYAEREYDVWLKMQDLYNSQYISKASGVSLDYAVEYKNLKRDGALAGFINEQAFWGGEGSTVLAGTRVGSTSDSQIEWQTLSDVVLGAGSSNIWNLVNDNVPDAGYFILKLLGQQTVQLPYNTTAANIEASLNALNGVFNATVEAGTGTDPWFVITFEKQTVDLEVESYTTIGGAATLTTSEEDTIGEYQALIYVEATVTGIQPANAFTIYSITAQDDTNLTDTLNIVAASEGTEIEQDDVLRPRALNTTLITRSATEGGVKSYLEDNDLIASAKIINNDTSEILFTGTVNEIPANSFKPYIFPYQELTDEQEEEVAQDLLTSKPLGIQSVGDEQYEVIDSSGYPTTIGFNYASDVEIYLTVEFTVDSSFIPGTEDTIKQETADWGNTLGAGEDVIVSGSNSICGQLSQYDGIVGQTIKVGKTSNPTSSSNIDIDDGTTSGTIEVSSWDIGRIVITTVEA